MYFSGYDLRFLSSMSFNGHDLTFQYFSGQYVF